MNGRNDRAFCAKTQIPRDAAEIASEDDRHHARRELDKSNCNLHPRSQASTNTIRGTQSFLATIAECWKRPSLLGLELLWRWAFGIPAAAVLAWETYRILSSVSLAGTGITHFSLIDTVTAAQILSATADVLLPPIREVARWLLATAGCRLGPRFRLWPLPGVAPI